MEAGRHLGGLKQSADDLGNRDFPAPGDRAVVEALRGLRSLLLEQVKGANARCLTTCTSPVCRILRHDKSNSPG